MPQRPLAGAVPKHIGARDAASTRRRGVDYRHGLVAVAGSPRCIARAEVFGDRFPPPEVLSQSGGQEQAGIRAQIRIVALDAQTIPSLALCRHLEGARRLRPVRVLLASITPALSALPASAPRRLPLFGRWL
jgi:hypothetical protein